MPHFAKPRVVLSKCIEIEACRYDGHKITSDFVKKLLPHVKVISVCPEVEIGLGTPRETLRIITKDGELRLIQPKTNLDLTRKMQFFIHSFLDSLPEVDGFILKSRSPTSAIKDAKIYSSPNRSSVAVGKGPGFLGRVVLERFSHLAVEDEGRLRNPRIKNHFLTKLYRLANFREVKSSRSTKGLLDFHSKNKLLLKAYNQKEMRILGRIVANLKESSPGEIIEDYQKHLLLALKRPPRCGSQMNVLMNSMGYFSQSLSEEEKRFFLESLKDYRAGTIPLSVTRGILNSWVLRFKDKYLLDQTFFEPYPKELMDIDLMTAYCDGKDYWK